MIKAVLFDIDGVLLDSFEANFQFYQSLLEKAGYRSPKLQEYLPLMHSPLKTVIKKLTSASEKEINRIMKVEQDFFTDLYNYDLLKIPAHAESTLQKLHAVYQLGIVTSRFKKHIFSMPQLMPLEKYFQVAVGVEDTAQHKPHPAPLLFATKQLGIKPEDAIYIGDAATDIMAGKAAGMKAILFGKEELIHADAWASSFSELPDIISRFV